MATNSTNETTAGHTYPDGGTYPTPDSGGPSSVVCGQPVGSGGPSSVVGGQPIRRLVLYRGLFLGDLLCSIPAFRALRHGFPEAEITLIGLPWARDFVQRTPYLDRFVEFPGFSGINEVPVDAERTAAFFADARAARYDLAIQMHGSGNTSNGFVAGLQARMSLGFRDREDQRIDWSLMYDPQEHEVLRWLRLVGTLGIVADDTSLDLEFSREEHAVARKLLDGHSGSGPVIALHAGAKHPARRWPVECFAALGDALVEQHGARIVLTGSAGEGDTTSAIQARMRYGATNLAGKTDLGTFTALLSSVDLLVTNDTGASHLAAATGTRSVILFGYSRPDQWAPLDHERHHVLDARSWAPDESPETVLAHLPVAAVLEVCEKQLSQTRDAAMDDVGVVQTLEQ